VKIVLAVLFLGAVVFIARLLNRFFNFSDHADNQDDEGGWK
jgi:hypothetical protein